MTNTAPDIDPARCPLCGEPNRCAMEMERETGQKQGPCWCVGATFSAELLQSVPSASAGLACICARCATASANPHG